MSEGLWGDLSARLYSAVILCSCGALGIYFGGVFFDLLLLVGVGLMHWELANMLSRFSRQTMWFSMFFSCDLV